MKRVQHLALSTIRHRRGALARCFDWMLRKHPDIMAQNPLRPLKRGFSTYTDEDGAILTAAGNEPRVDIERDRRLAPDEECDILAVLANHSAESVFFLLALALGTAMRMRECYALRVDQVNIEKKTVHVERSKNARRARCRCRASPGRCCRTTCATTGVRSMRATVGRSRSGTAIIRRWRWAEPPARSRGPSGSASQGGGLRGAFHDLRHEAMCRLYERTALSDVLIPVPRPSSDQR